LARPRRKQVKSRSSCVKRGLAVVLKGGNGSGTRELVDKTLIDNPSHELGWIRTEKPNHRRKEGGPGKLRRAHHKETSSRDIIKKFYLGDGNWNLQLREGKEGGKVSFQYKGSQKKRRRLWRKK